MSRNKKYGVIDVLALFVFYIIALPICAFLAFISVFGKSPKRRRGKFCGPGTGW